MRTFLCAVLFLIPSFALAAQFDDVLLSSSPENPRPGERVTVTATVLGADSSGSVFTWLVNDKKTLEGVGNTILTVDAPQLGGNTNIRLLINGTERSVPFTLHSGDVALEWEALTTAPPFYVGRSLLGGQGTMRVFAVPDILNANGTRVPARDLNFLWRVNGSARASVSGYGAQSIVIKPPFYNDAFVLSVLVSSRSGQRAERSARIRVADPDVVLYERTPLGGILDTRAVLGEYPFTNEEVTFAAYPLSSSQPANLEYQWTLNGDPVAVNSGDPRVAVFRKTGSGTGKYTIGLNITSQKAFLDLVRHSFLLHF